MATQLQLRKIAARVLPDLAADFALSQKNLFLARVMSVGSLEDANVIVEHFGKPTLRDVLRNPPARIFDRESWNYWHLYLDLEPVKMPEAFFTLNPWFKDAATDRREIAANILTNLPAHEPAYSADEARMS